MNAVDWDEIRVIFERNVPPDLRHYSADIAAEATVRLYTAVERGTEIENPIAYGLGIVRIVALETRRKENLTAVEDFDCAAPPEQSLDDPNADRSGDLATLKKRVLSTSERHLLDEYYKEGRHMNRRREKLAVKLGISMGTLYTRVCRLKDRLREAAADDR